MRCAQCNEVNAWTLARCRSCGAPLAASTSSGPGTDAGFFNVSVDGMWHSYMVIVLILAVAVVGYLVLRAGFSSPPFGLSASSAGYLLAGAAGLNLLLAVVSFATKPAGTNWQYGAYIGLAAAIVAVIAPVKSVMAARHG